jgi:hypothetical protein
MPLAGPAVRVCSFCTAGQSPSHVTRLGSIIRHREPIQASEMDASDMISLANGVDLPLIGLGTFKSRGESVKLAVRTALQHGIRHIDTASIYKVVEWSSSEQ